MKIIRNGICYVESEDIEFLENKPRGVLLERKAKVSYSTIFNFEKYFQEQSVLYFQENECIIDYNSICNLPNDELDSKIQEIEEQLNKYTSIYVSASLAAKEKLDQSQEYNYGLKKLEHILKGLKAYKASKSDYDREISNLNFKGKIKKAPLNYQAACAKISSTKKIPISSSKLEELDRSIRDKCKQNAIERKESKEIAQHYIVGSTSMNIYQKQIGKRK